MTTTVKNLFTMQLCASVSEPWISAEFTNFTKISQNSRQLRISYKVCTRIANFASSLQGRTCLSRV